MTGQSSNGPMECQDFGHQNLAHAIWPRLIKTKLIASSDRTVTSGGACQRYHSLSGWNFHPGPALL